MNLDPPQTGNFPDSRRPGLRPGFAGQSEISQCGVSPVKEVFRSHPPNGLVVDESGRNARDQGRWRDAVADAGNRPGWSAVEKAKVHIRQKQTVRLAEIR